MQGGGRARMSDLGPGRRAQEMVRRPENSAGQQLYPGGLPVGSEPFWGNWLTPLPALGDDSILGAFAENFLRYLAFEPDAGPLYSSAQFDFDKDLPRMAPAARLFSATTFNPAAPADLPSTDLSAFAKHGGKLIIYHGWADMLVTPQLSNSVLRRHRRTRRRRGAGKGLCPSVHDTGHGSLRRIHERPGYCRHRRRPADGAGRLGRKETTPDQLLATKTDDKGQTLWQRPVCAWPQTAVYRSGDPALAASYSCAENIHENPASGIECCARLYALSPRPRAGRAGKEFLTGLARHFRRNRISRTIRSVCKMMRLGLELALPVIRSRSN